MEDQIHAERITFSEFGAYLQNPKKRKTAQGGFAKKVQGGFFCVPAPPPAENGPGGFKPPVS